MSTGHYDQKIKVIRKCDICGIESNPGGMGNHQRSSGHTGYTQRTINFEMNGNPKIFYCLECEAAGDLPSIASHLVFSKHAGYVSDKNDKNRKSNLENSSPEMIYSDIPKPLSVLPEKKNMAKSPTFLEKLEQIPIDRQLLGYFLVIALRFVYFLLLIIILIRV